MGTLATNTLTTPNQLFSPLLDLPGLPIPIVVRGRENRGRNKGEMDGKGRRREKKTEEKAVAG